MRRHGDCRYTIHQVYVSSLDKDLSSQTATQFSVTLPTEFKRVVAVRPLNVVLYDDATTIAQIELGGALLPIRTFAAGSLFLRLNDYDHLHTAKAKNVPIFTRFQGEEQYPAASDNFWLDPYTFILNPSEPRLKRFTVTIYDSTTMNVYTPTVPVNAAFHMTLAIYTEESNCDP